MPIESIARYFAPSSVFNLICNVLSLPMKAFLILKTTLTLLPSSVVDSTVPALTPAISTVSFGCRLASSVKYAEYDVPLPISGKDAALNAAQSRPRINTSPIAPITVGLRALNGLPPTLTRRVFIGELPSLSISLCVLIAHD